MGADLLSISSLESTHELQAYLPVWRDGLRTELQTNMQGQLRRHQPAIASHLSPHFPDINIILQYTKPVSSASTLSLIDKSHWALRNINISKLVKLCERTFSWDMPTGIATKFIHVIWSGMLFRTLLQVRSCCSFPNSVNNIHSYSGQFREYTKIIMSFRRSFGVPVASQNTVSMRTFNTSALKYIFSI